MIYIQSISILYWNTICNPRYNNNARRIKKEEECSNVFHLFFFFVIQGKQNSVYILNEYYIHSHSPKKNLIEKTNRFNIFFLHFLLLSHFIIIIIRKKERKNLIQFGIFFSSMSLVFGPWLLWLTVGVSVVVIIVVVV